MSSGSQVVVVASVEVKPGSEDAALEIFSETIRRTHDEAGCLNYALHRDEDNPQRFVLIERWTSQVALENHTLQPYVTDLLARIAEHLAGPPAIHRCSPMPIGDEVKGTL